MTQLPRRFFLGLTSSLIVRLSCAAHLDVASIVVSSASTPPGLPIPTDFASLSLEVNEAPLFLGLPQYGAKTAFVELMRALSPGTGPRRGPQLRIGGNSADHSVWWPPGSGPLPPNMTYAITDADLHAYVAAVPQWNGSIVVDTNMFRENNTAYATALVAALGRDIGWGAGAPLPIVGVEVGNEPNAYNSRSGGCRPPSWGYPDYVREFSAHVGAMSAAGLPPRLVQGAVYSGHEADFFNPLPSYTRTFAAAGVLGSVSVHRYPLGPPTNISALLDDSAAEGSAAFLAPFAAAAAASGVEFVCGEANSVYDGGQHGVSDVFGAALWGADFGLALAAAGVRRVNFEGGPHQAYTPIAIAPETPGPEGTPIVRPLFYALLLLARATQGQPVSLNTSVTTTNPHLKAWSLLSTGDGVALRVVVLHKDPSASGNATVTVTPPTNVALYRNATIERLLARGNNASEVEAITFAGQTYAGSTNGLPVGPIVTETVFADALGRFTFSMPPASGVLLTVNGLN